MSRSAGILRRIELTGALALLSALMLAACGERRPSERHLDSSAEAPLGRGTGGAMARDGAGGHGGSSAANDGAAGDADSVTDALTDAGTDVSCGDRFGVLWQSLEDAELGVPRLGQCVPVDSGTTGALIFDGDGRLVGVTGQFRSDAPAPSDWLAMFANDRFPCFAGQTVKYSCTAD